MADTIRCSLLGNALAHLNEAGQYARQGKNRSLPFALSNLGNGMELLLKSRLEIKDWRLVVVDPDKVTEADYRAGRFTSVTLQTALMRLRDECGVQVTAGQKKVLKRLAELRNMVAHHSLRVDRPVLYSVVVKVYSFALDFIRDEIEGKTKQAITRRLRRLRSLLGRFEEFVQQRMTELEKLLANTYSPPVDCLVCLQPAMHSEGDGSKCEFCGLSGRGDDLAAEWAEKKYGWVRIQDGDEPHNRPCPECGAEACVRTGEG